MASISSRHGREYVQLYFLGLDHSNRLRERRYLADIALYFHVARKPTLHFPSAERVKTFAPNQPYTSTATKLQKHKALAPRKAKKRLELGNSLNRQDFFGHFKDNVLTEASLVGNARSFNS